MLLDVGTSGSWAPFYLTGSFLSKVMSLLGSVNMRNKQLKMGERKECASSFHIHYVCVLIFSCCFIPSDFCYGNEDLTFSISEAIKLCVTVVAYAPESFRRCWSIFLFCADSEKAWKLHMAWGIKTEDIEKQHKHYASLWGQASACWCIS